ncbi:MAG: DJ-1/PfpI family protein [Pseudomonadota bacterium]
MRRLVALAFPGFEPLDLYGPLEMFGLMPEAFAISVAAVRPGAVQSARGITGWADTDLLRATKADLLLVPGGPGTPEAIADPALLDWIARTSDAADLTMSVCTGSTILAKAGVLSGRAATTNKASFEKIIGRGPDVRWVRQARWVEDGPIFTSSGLSAGMDMALAVIERLHGRAAADDVALMAEYTWHDEADLDPFAAAHGLVAE